MSQRNDMAVEYDIQKDTVKMTMIRLDPFGRQKDKKDYTFSRQRFDAIMKSINVVVPLPNIVRVTVKDLVSEVRDALHDDEVRQPNAETDEERLRLIVEEEIRWGWEETSMYALPHGKPGFEMFETLKQLGLRDSKRIAQRIAERAVSTSWEDEPRPDHPEKHCGRTNNGTSCGHSSDCSTHNAPAMKPGPCDCGKVER